MNTGKVKWFDSKKGYGFILGDDERDVFVHYSNILMGGFKALVEGQAVGYDVEPVEKGLKAINVVIR